MKSKSIADTNPFLKDQKASKRRVRSLASSTAIETGESINRIERKITHLRAARRRVTLA